MSNASYRKAMLEAYAKRAKEYDRRHDVTLRELAANEWRETATDAEARRAPAYLTWTGRRGSRVA